MVVPLPFTPVPLTGQTFAVLLAGAAGVIGYPFYTNLYEQRLQGQLDRQLASPELKEAYRNRSFKIGDSLTRIKIPALDVDVVVVVLGLAPSRNRGVASAEGGTVDRKRRQHGTAHARWR